MKKMIRYSLFPIGIFLGAMAGAGVVFRKMVEEEIKWKEMADKHLELFLLMYQWVRVKQEGKNLISYFEKTGYRKIAVYGMGHVGKALLDEIKGSRVEIAYGIDKSAADIFENIEICNPDGSLEEVDAVVVTPVYFMNEIEETLSTKINCPIISLEDILYQV